jgi:hypothetical protein
MSAKGGKEQNRCPWKKLGVGNTKNILDRKLAWD